MTISCDAAAVLADSFPASVTPRVCVALTSSVMMSVPSEIRSPTATSTVRTIPARGAGISMLALSLSSVISDASSITESPGETKTSMTSTSLKSPMSGTLTSMMSPLLSFMV